MPPGTENPRSLRKMFSMVSPLLRLVFRVDPDADFALLVIHGNQHPIPMLSQGTHRRGDVQLILVAGEQRLHHLEGNLGVYPGAALLSLSNLGDQIAPLLGDL